MSESKAARHLRRNAERALYTRNSGDLLTQGAEGLVWLGSDSGGGAYPIGPNGPWTYGHEPVAVVTRATSLITSPLTAAPFRVEDTTVRGRWLSPARWLTDPMLLRPDARFPQAHPYVARLTRAAFWGAWIRSAAWWGIGAFLAAEDVDGAPLAGSLKLADPRLIVTERDDSGALVWAIASEDSDPAGRAVFDREGRIRFGAITYRLVVLRNPHSPIDAEGRSLGVFDMYPRVFRLTQQMDEYASGTFRSGIPAGYLKVAQPHLSQQAAEDLKKAWMTNHGGDRRSIAVLNAVTDFHALALSPVDSALGEMKRLNVADVAFAFGLDPMTLGAGLNNSATYSNLRDAWENHADFGLAPWIAAVEDTLGALHPANQAVRVNLDRFANPAPAERYSAYATAINCGVLTVNEARDAEGLPPLPDPEPVIEPEKEPDAEDLEGAQEGSDSDLTASDAERGAQARRIADRPANRRNEERSHAHPSNAPNPPPRHAGRNAAKPAPGGPGTGPGPGPGDRAQGRAQGPDKAEARAA